MSEKELYSEDVERALLGAILINPDAISEIDLNPSDFYLQKHATIYKAMLELARAGEPIDNITLKRELDKNNLYERVGGFSYIAELAGAAPDSLNAASYAEIVKDYAKRRKAVELTSRLATAAYNENQNFEAAITDAISAMSALKTLKLDERRKTSWTIDELLATDFPEPNWIVPNLIPEGLAMLTGRPKVGKSWMALQLAGAVAFGGVFLGEKVEKGEVLYLALEDNARRVKERWNLLRLREAPVRFEFLWRPMQEGGLDDLFLECERERYRVIIVDTLARAIPGVNLNDENPVGVIVNNLQSVAINHNITVLLVHHTRKSAGAWQDPIDDIMGSTSLSRAIDTVLAIYRQQGRAGTLLKGRGRDIEDIDLAIKFEPMPLCWQSLGGADEVQISETKRKILEYLEGAGKASLASIAQGIDKYKSNVCRNLQDLINDNKVRKETIEGKVYYEKV